MLSEEFYVIDSILPRVLPTFDTPSLCCVSDYSPGRPANKFEVFSFLYLDPFMSDSWPELRLAVRDLSLGDIRTMSYKGLNDKRKRDSLLPFLDAANCIHGLLLNVAVHRELQEFKFENAEFEHWNSAYLTGHWKRRTFEKAMTVATLFAFGISGYSDSSTTVTWLTDNDAIAESADRRHDLLRLARARIERIAMEAPLSMRLQVPSTTELPKQAAEDLLSIPDLAAGCVADIINEHYARHGVLDIFDDFVISGEFEKEKDHLICQWLRRTGEPLKKLTVSLYPPSDGIGRMDVRILPHYHEGEPFTKIERAPTIRRIYQTRDRINRLAS